MDPRENNEIKNIIRSLLISNPRQSTIQQLCSDFSEIEGRPIPAHKYGFRSVEEYLRTIPDVVHILGYGPHALIECVVTSKTEHINEMVLKQKKSNVKKGSFQPRRYNFQPNYKNNKFPNVKYNYVNKPNWSRNSPQPQKPILKFTSPQQSYNNIYSEPFKEVKSHSEKNLDLVKFHEESQPVQNGTIHKEYKTDKFHLELHKVENVVPNTKIDVESSNDCDSIIKKSENLNTENYDLTCENSTDTCTEDFDFDKNTSRLPSKVYERLSQLIKKFPDGIECSKLPDEYKTLFKKKLHHEDYNYRSVIEMCADLPDIFYFFQKASDDYILFDKTLPAPNVESKEEVKRTDAVEAPSAQHILEELPKGLGLSLIPDDVVTKEDQILRYKTVDLSVGDLLDINIGEIYDLSKFWIYYTFGKLDPLMEELQTFFAANRSRYAIPKLLQEIDLHCVSIYADAYHRCLIVSLLPEGDFVRVFFIDYGTVENVPSDSLWFLPKRFAEVPSQAIRARLSNICPVYENRPWPRSAVNAFSKLISRRVLVADVTKVLEEDHCLEIYLTDITKKENIFYINEVLVEQGHAVYIGEERKPTPVDFDCMPIVRHIHLYPVFYEIESGIAPTPTEMKYLTNNNVPLHHYMPQYFNIYYSEDTKGIQLQHEKSNQRRLSSIAQPPIPPEEDFDFGWFKGSTRAQIEELMKSKPSEAETEHFMNFDNEIGESDKKSLLAKRKSQLLQCSSNDEEVSERSVSRSPSNISNISDASQDLMCNINGLSVSDDVSPKKCTNPFHTDYDACHTNPFKVTNPFICDLEGNTDNSEFSDLFSRSSDDSLPQRIVNNLRTPKETNLNLSVHSNANLTSVSNVAPTALVVPSTSGQPIVTTENVRVRTPPGFQSINRGPVVPNAHMFNFGTNYSNLNPHYLRFPFNQLNNNGFFMPNRAQLPLGPQPFIPQFLPPYYTSSHFGFNVHPNYTPYYGPPRPPHRNY